MKYYGGDAVNSHPIQKLMSRTGSFPVEMAHRFISAYCPRPSIVLDPFCGKGTTLLAARLLGHSAYGIDIAPEAAACSAAKLTSVTLDSFSKYVSQLRLGTPRLQSVPQSVLTFFDEQTLRQIISLRNHFVRDRESEKKTIRSHATFGLGCLLGILHGHASYSLSIPSAHAFSMSPNYVTTFAAKHGLTAPLQDVKACILAKAGVLLATPLPKQVRGDVRIGCAREMSAVYPKLMGTVDLILTSPPYLDAQTYAKDNWLRLWLLGFDHRNLKQQYIETGSLDLYRTLMIDVLRQCHTMLRPGGKLVLIAGDVRRKTRDGLTPFTIFKTGLFLELLLKDTVKGLEVEKKGRHVIKSSSRYFHSLSNSNGHAKTPLTERFFVATKGDG